MSVYNVNGIELATIYGLNGTALEQCYDIDGNELIEGGSVIFLDNAIISNIYTSNITSQPQGGCIDDDGNVYVCFYSAGKFLKHNISTGENMEVSFTPNAYGHANGMAYNPNTDYLYLASMNSTGEVFVFDKSFNLVNTLYARDENGDIFNCWNIAYDREHQKFIVMHNNKMFFMDDNFEYINHSTYVSSAVWPYTAQDIETDGMYVYAVGYNPNHITVVDFNGNVVKMISNTAFLGEPESMCYDWINDKYYIEGKSTYYVIREAVFKQM